MGGAERMSFTKSKVDQRKRTCVAFLVLSLTHNRVLKEWRSNAIGVRYINRRRIYRAISLLSNSSSQNENARPGLAGGA
jgi:hypothetical protein